MLILRVCGTEQTIVQSDQIFVVKGGSIVEKGSHHELLAAKGEYADLWDKQIR
jgi:ABC-type transport system involved in Fe-S cluster assembly fused permease/ATPase subunit